MEDDADKLVDKLFTWMKLLKKCARKLDKLAAEMEDRKKNVNISKVVGSSVSTGWALALTTAGVLTLLSGGAAVPFLLAAGATATGLGVATTVGSEVVDVVASSSNVEESQRVFKKVKEVEEEIQELVDTLKEEGRRREEAGGLSPDDYVMERILRALAKRNGLRIKNTYLLSLLHCIGGLSIDELSTGGYIALNQLMSVLGLQFSKFSVRMAAKTVWKTLVSAGGKEVGKEVGKEAGKGLAVSIGGKAAAKAAGRIAGGTVGLVFSVTELVINCKDLDKCETQTSKSLRESADALRTASEELKTLLDEIQKILKEMAKSQQEEEKGKADRKKQREKKKGSDQKRDQDQTQGKGWTLENKKKNCDEEEKDEDEDKTSGTIKIGLLNVRSLNNKRSIIRNLITKNKLDVFCTTETWTNPETADTVLTQASPPNFSAHHYSRPSRGGGVAIQFSQELESEQIDFGQMETFEYVATLLQHAEWDAPVLIITLYRPPGYNEQRFRLFLDEFENLMSETEWYSIIVTGDFNIRVDQNQRSYTDEFYYLWPLYGLTQHVNEPTHQKGHTLDLVFSRNFEISNLFVRNDNISDHFTVYFNARPVSIY